MYLPYANINGELVDRASASLQITDLALLRGYGIFDFLRIRHGKATFLEDHLDRFFQSAIKMELDMPVSKEVLKERLADLQQANQAEHASLRMLLTGGYSDDGFTPTSSNLILLMQEFRGYPGSLFEQGIRLMPYEYIRELADVKTINYSVPILLRKKIKEAGATDVLYHKEGIISESSRANFFIVTADGSLVTPRQNILFGITRKHLLKIARQFCKVVERPITMEELKGAREAFVSSSTKGALAVVQVGDTVIGNGHPGAITQKLKALFEEYALAESSAFVY